MEAEHRLRDDRERAERSRGELRQVVARDVLDHLAAALRERAVGQCQRDPDDQVAERAEARHERPVVARGEDPADRGALRPERVEGEALPVLGQRRLQPRDAAPRLHGRRQIGPGVLQYAIESRRGQDEVGAARRPAPIELRAAPARDDGQAREVGAGEHAGDRCRVAGLDDPAGRDAIHGIRGRGEAQMLRAHDGRQLIPPRLGLLGARRTGRHPRSRGDAARTGRSVRRTAGDAGRLS